jgi:hypothetical protein
MDDNQSDSLSLLEFINGKCNNNENIDHKKLLYLYTKCIRNSIVNSYQEQKDILYSISCAELISNIFKIIYNYSLNIKLTIFMCERCTLLFNEYLNISNNFGSDRVNLLDVKQFIINKSIGPIVTKDNKNILNKYNNLMLLLKNLIIKASIKQIKEDTECNFNLEDYLESISCILVNSFTNIYNLGFDNLIQNKLDKIFKFDILDIPREINILKIYLELFLYNYNILSNDYKKSKKNAENLIENNINLIDSNIELNEFFSYSEPIHDKKFFLELIKKTKN